MKPLPSPATLPFAAAVWLLLVGVSPAPAQSLDEEWMANIPAGHPRLWWDEESLDAARQWYASHPFTPSRSTDPVVSSSDPVGNAFKYLLTGDAGTCQIAHEWSMNALDPWTGLSTTVRPSSCNECRWYGESVILVYDWCHDALDARQRQSLLEAGNEVFPVWLQARWGGPQMPESNYFWGYWRNAVLWGIATHGTGTVPGELLHEALVTWWKGHWLPHVATCNQGGVPAEGSSYAPYLLRYPVVAFHTLLGLGRDLVGETDFYERSVFFTVYNTLPDSHHDPRRNATGWDKFPYGDAAAYMDGPSPAVDGSTAGFMAWATLSWPASAIGQYARRWLADTGAAVPPFMDALLDRTTAVELHDLPLDFHAPGCSSHSILRTSWSQKDSVVHLQLASPPIVGHEHQDTGSFQLWRNGRWLVREAAGRGTGSGWTVPGFGGTAPLDVHRTPAHSTLLVAPDKGHGHQASTGAGVAAIRRLVSRPEYFSAVTDMTPAYHSEDNDARYGNPEASHVEREFLYIRPLETLVVLDRVNTLSDDSTAAFLLHLMGKPTATGNRHTLTSGTEQLVLDTLLPEAPTARIIDEAREDGLHRLEEVSPPGSMHYFLHVAQAKAVAEAAVRTRLEATADGYLLTVTHPEKGTALFRFGLGDRSTGSQFGFQQTGTPDLQDLPEAVETFEVGAAGPQWRGAGDAQARLSVGDVTIQEGDSDTVTATFTVTLSSP